MKKKLIILCVLVMLVMGMAVNAHAASATAALTASSSSVSAGSEVTLTLSLTGYEGTLSGWSSVGLRYDSTAFEYVAGSLTKASRLGTVSFTNPVNQNGTFTIGASMTDVPDAGDMLTLKFRALSNAAVGEKTFQILNVSVTTVNGDTFDTKTPANVTITKAPCTTHTWGDWTETKAATCTETGTKTHTCSECGTSASENIPAKGHTFTNVAATTGTNCQTKGTIAYKTCSVCSKNFASNAGNTATAELTTAQINNGAVGNHTFGSVVDAVKGSDCKTNGTAAYKPCTVCNKKFATDAAANATTEYDPAGKGPKGNHTTEAVEAHAATCEAPGNIAYNHCTACEKNFADANPAADATALASVADPQKNHTLTSNNDAVAATKEEAGHAETFHCADCDKDYIKDADGNAVLATAENVVIPKLTDKPVETTKPGTSTDNKTGDKKAPKTGDETNIALWVVLFVLCATVVTVVATKKLRKN